STPDFNNISGLVQLQNQGSNREAGCCQNPFALHTQYHPQADFSRNVKRLNLNRPLENVPDSEAKENAEGQRRVTFAGKNDGITGNADKSEQASFECPFCNGKENKCPHGSKKKRKSRSPVKKIRIKRDNESSTESTEEESDKNVQGERRRNKDRNRSDSQYYSDTE
ncbi:hypothetical protein NQ317_014730, partial [Molorchus minor]